jgi:hypothetical protein
MGAIDLPKKPERFPSEKPSAVGYRNSLAQKAGSAKRSSISSLKRRQIR